MRPTNRDAGKYSDIKIQRQGERIRLQIFLSPCVTEVRGKRIFCGKTKRVWNRSETESRVRLTIKGKAEKGKNEESAQRVAGKPTECGLIREVKGKVSNARKSAMLFATK